MLQIGYVVICEDVIQDNNQSLIKRPLAALVPLSIPGNYSFKVAFSLHNTNKEDFGKNNTLRLFLSDPDDNIITDTGILNIQTNNPPENSSVEIAEADVGMNNVEFYKEGIHTLHLNINDNEKTVKIPIIKRPNTGESK